ncbi:MAG: YchJ family protein [Gammaproteobacteria bacterium]|nr:YchJ family protein [Gammaproteobacteria bacterium]
MTQPDTTAENPCPCGSGELLSFCCLPIIEGNWRATTAEQLMRSRYSAYVLDYPSYILKSWHPSTRPSSLKLDANDLSWTELRVLDCSDGGGAAFHSEVTFCASYRQQGEQGEMCERSRFLQQEGEWFYVDGESLTTPTATNVKVGRNQPCPCGSGRKFKKCCGGR